MKLAEATWAQISALSKDTPVVIPIAAVEQHGHHLPLSTDSMLLGEVIRRIEMRMSADVLVAPLQWLGNSHHHIDFAGTLSAPPRVYLDLLNSLIDNFLTHGFQRVILLTGHGGNIVPGKQATFEVRQRYRDRDDLLLLSSEYWSLGESPKSIIEDLYQDQMAHACEWETSMMLCIAPELVGEYKNLPAIEPGNPFRPASRAWITKDRSEPGYIGWPQFATQAKGEALLARFSGDVCQMLQRMISWDGHSWEG